MNTEKSLIIGAVGMVVVSAGIFIYYYNKKDISPSIIPTKNTNISSGLSATISNNPDNSSLSIAEMEAILAKTGIEKGFSELEKLLHIDTSSTKTDTSGN